MNETRKKIINITKKVTIFYGNLYLHSWIQKINAKFLTIEVHPQGPQPYIPYRMKYKVLFPTLFPTPPYSSSYHVIYENIPLLPLQKINKELKKVAHHTCGFLYLHFVILISFTHPIS
jgi:hypothetical protein